MLAIVDELKNEYVVSTGLIVTIAVIVLAVYVALYLLRSFGLYTLAKRRNMDKLYLAFIPILWIYTASKLAGHVTFFGARIKKFALWATIVIGISMTLNFVYNLLMYFPLIGYFLQGGEVFVISSAEAIPTGAVPYVFDGTFYVRGISYPYELTSGIATMFNIMMVVNYLLDILQILIFINIYMGIFKKYWTKHVFAGTILSVFGFFGIVIFAVRKHNEVNFDEYMRAKMYYANGMNNPNVYNEERERAYREEQRQARQNDPFAEFLRESEKEPEDPFGEFEEDVFKELSDKKDDNDSNNNQGE